MKTMANRLTLLVVYTVITTIGCLAVPMALALDLRLAIASVGIAAVLVFGVAVTYRDISKDLSEARESGRRKIYEV
jgi:hypothetical protein